MLSLPFLNFGQCIFFAHTRPCLAWTQEPAVPRSGYWCQTEWRFRNGRASFAVSTECSQMARMAVVFECVINIMSGIIKQDGRRDVHFLYLKLVKDEHLTPDQRAFSRRHFSKGFLAWQERQALPEPPRPARPGRMQKPPRIFQPGSPKIIKPPRIGSRPFLKRARKRCSDIMPMILSRKTLNSCRQSTKEDLHKAFVVFNNSGADSPFGVHKFEARTFDGGPAGPSQWETRKGPMPEEWKGYEADAARQRP